MKKEDTKIKIKEGEIVVEIGKNLLEAIKFIVNKGTDWKSSHLIKEAFNIDFTAIVQAVTDKK